MSARLSTANIAARCSTTSTPCNRAAAGAVPDVLGVGTSSWAMPCVPVTGKQMGGLFVPEIGAGVWVEFEQGDPDHPIWTGCLWGRRRVPALATRAAAVAEIVLQTAGQNTLPTCGGPAGAHLLRTDQSPRPAILINDVGITISNGKGATISDRSDGHINDGALVDHLSGRCPASSSTSARPSCAPTADRPRRRAVPRVLVSGQPVATLARPTSSPAARSRRPAARASRPMDRGRDARPRRGVPGSSRAASRLRAHRHADDRRCVPARVVAT